MLQGLASFASIDLSSESHACVSYMAAWRIVQRVFSRKYNQNGRRGALYYVYFHENITKTGCCTFYAQLWNGPRELLIRLDGFKAVGGANESCKTVWPVSQPSGPLRSRLAGFGTVGRL